MSDPTARVLRLLSLLQTYRFWPGPELAEALEVSERTVRRDVDRLRELGYSGDATPGAGGGERATRGGAGGARAPRPPRRRPPPRARLLGGRPPRRRRRLPAQRRRPPAPAGPG